MKECQGMAVGVKLSFQSKNGQGKKGQGKNGAAVRTRTGDLYFTKAMPYQFRSFPLYLSLENSPGFWLRGPARLGGLKNAAVLMV
jgi:hypothetical protein